MATQGMGQRAVRIARLTERTIGLLWTLAMSLVLAPGKVVLAGFRYEYTALPLRTPSSSFGQSRLRCPFQSSHLVTHFRES